MTTQAETPEALAERVSRLEGAYEHLATKADLADLKGEIRAAIAELEARLIKWTVGSIIGAIAVVAAIVSLLG